LETLAQLAVLLLAFAVFVAIAWHRGKTDPVDRLWIPIAVAVLPLLAGWIVTYQDPGARETVFGVGVAALGVLGIVVMIWWESSRVGSHVREFREAIAISVFGALFGLSWFLFAGSTASPYGLLIFACIHWVGWARYQYAKRGGWW